ncbi:MAG TPA: zinc-binding alcohol dehydrogenase family protein [Polyangiales bacterium]|nr:zinc-binding alcohol dehydrogenase family protein [Polyangiales bacterium]
MKAAAYSKAGPPSVLVYQDVPDPICGPRDVVIDVHAISIEGGDVLARSRGMVQPDGAPHVGGYLAAGVICEVGAEVTDRHVGQRVATSAGTGSHASKRAVRANSAWPVPDSLDLKHAACIPIPFGTADDCLFEFGRLKAGESVLIHAGSSGVGLAAIQLAKRAGALVLATASSEEKLERLKAYGLDHGINYTAGSFVKPARDLTNGGPDLVVDSVGGKNLELSMQCAAYRGRIVSMGAAGRDTHTPSLTGLMGQNKTLISYYQGAELAAPSQRVRARQNVQRLIGEVAEGRLQVVIDRTYKLSEAAEAHTYIESRRQFGRVMLIPDARV